MAVVVEMDVAERYTVGFVVSLRLESLREDLATFGGAEQFKTVSGIIQREIDELEGFLAKIRYC